MIYDRILVRFGELTMKGRNRGRFEQQLLRQIKLSLRAFSALQYEKTYGRIYIILNGEPYDKVAERLKDVFGLSSFSPVKRAEPELESIRDTALDVMRSLSSVPSTFKVSVRRGWKEFHHDSQQMNHLVGSHVLRAIPALKVDVRSPQVELRVDIQYEGAYIYCESIAGAGGFPYGTSGKALLLLSGGIDSPVAGWLALRKGLELEAVHFHSYPFTSEQAKQKVIALARRLAHYTGRPLKLHLVPFTEVQTALAGQKQDHLMITMMRRAMLRITGELAERHGASAVVTGDSLGQVASQTLGSMNVIGRTMELPLLRPLIMMDKQEIIDIAERIGTFATSILPFEDCCTLFVPKSPSTNPNLRVVEKVESFIPELDAMLQRAVDGTETVSLRATDREPEFVHTTAAAGENDWF
ncbi:tRNA uracil 4-sulfurtransferase ThiI [Paenibacillus beijingensis]|uniref:Probable tRNA sulfurtransferase n=1 Tax=Paenibacillus beijingensis TaxID=1126833 RepID=A0A0D5NLY8_9BACL|nr:tRNA uracil 4-sulfurtransferase ThiI [Paenibacillus beijingensis]AJY76344.1 thiamine biosynthesis protein ThiI [Paenibacillus beijingensis]